MDEEKVIDVAPGSRLIDVPKLVYSQGKLVERSGRPGPVEEPPFVVKALQEVEGDLHVMLQVALLTLDQEGRVVHFEHPARAAQHGKFVAFDVALDEAHGPIPIAQQLVERRHLHVHNLRWADGSPESRPTQSDLVLLNRDVKLQNGPSIGCAAVYYGQLVKSELKRCRSKILHTSGSGIESDHFARFADSLCEPEGVNADVASDVDNEITGFHLADCPSNLRFGEVVRFVGVHSKTGTCRQS